MNLLLDNLEVIFYDMNLLRAFDTNLDLGLSSSSIRKKNLGGRQESNPGPLAWWASVLTTRPRCLGDCRADDRSK